MHKPISFFLSFITALVMTLALVSCGEDAGSNIGQGGPDITPDSIEVSDPPASGAVVDEITAPDEDTSTAIADPTIEGPVDPGLAEDPEDIFGADKDEEGNVTETPPEKDKDVADSNIDQEADTDTSASDGIDQGGLSYSLDSSQGKWFEEKRQELFPSEKSKAVNTEIKQLRDEIKKIKADYKNKLVAKDDALKKITHIREKIHELRNIIGSGGGIQNGIYTSWANENLFLNINNAESGWYSITIVAKAREKIPADYSRFAFNIIDAATGDILSSISVKASPERYFSGSTVLKLDKPSGQKLNILWTNDAYKEKEYNVNLNIKKILLKKVREPKVKTADRAKFKGDQYTFIEGRWFFEKSNAYTHWANQTIGYTFKNLEEGTYKVTIKATNHGDLDLPKKYDNFIVAVDSHYGSTEMRIPAHNKGWKQGESTINLPAGDTTLYLTWLNDQWVDGEYDANIKIESIDVKKIKASSLTAYLLKTKPGNRLFILIAFLVISGILSGIYVKNRMKTAQ